MTTDPDNPETLAAVKTEAEATIIAGMLEENGIEATVTGGFTSGFKAGVPGEVRVLVRNSDLARAADLLDEVHPADEDIDEDFDEDVEDEPPD